MMFLSFGSSVSGDAGRARRVRARTEVMEGVCKQRDRIAEPMKPVEPYSTTFMIDIGYVILAFYLELYGKKRLIRFLELETLAPQRVTYIHERLLLHCASLPT